MAVILISGSVLVSAQHTFILHFTSVNVQAACDHKCRFVYAAVAAPGGANDIAAFRKIQLSQVIQKLPPKIFLDGDNAYICTETLLTPFSGVEKEDPAKDAFNFYLS